MPVGSEMSLLAQLTRDSEQLAFSAHDLRKRRVIPLIESRAQCVRALDMFAISPERKIRALFLRHCNLFELTDLMEQARQRGIATYVNIDHIDGIHADSAGLRYLTETMHIRGIISNNPRILALGKSLGLETIQRIFALDSTGLDAALESVDNEQIDLLDISPALVVPYISESLKEQSRPFLASGLLQTHQQVAAVVQAGATGVLVTRDDLWM